MVEEEAVFSVEEAAVVVGGVGEEGEEGEEGEVGEVGEVGEEEVATLV